MAALLRLAVIAVVITAIASGCTYSDREPGLFPSPRTQPSASPTRSTPPRSTPPEPTNPALPVAGEAVWTTADGLGVTVRFAVHAVRRVPGATVLDWSVTPLRAPHLKFGDPISRPVDLGLTTVTGGDADLALVDVGNYTSYPPLRHRSPRVFNHCLCTPLWVVQQQLRIGETRLLQVAYAELPASTTHVDVTLANVAPVTHVPVTPIGMAPTARVAVDLARAADQGVATSAPPAATATVGVDGSTKQRVEVRIDRIIAAQGSTSLEWTITALTDQTRTYQTGLGSPVTRPVTDSVQLINLNPANGPQLLMDGRERSVSWLQTDTFGFRAYDCRCSDLGLWSKSVTRSGGSAQLVSTYPALPPGTTAVGVSLPGRGVIAEVPVLPSNDAARELAPPTNRPTSTWRYSLDDPPHGWRTADWPTDVPDPAQLGDYLGRSQSIVDLS